MEIHFGALLQYPYGSKDSHFKAFGPKGNIIYERYLSHFEPQSTNGINGSFQKSGVLIYTPNSRTFVIRTLVKEIPNL